MYTLASSISEGHQKLCFARNKRISQRQIDQSEVSNFKRKIGNSAMLVLSLAIGVSFSGLIQTSNAAEDTDLISLFPLENYSQSVETWIQPKAKEYDQLLISSEQQTARLNEFIDHYFSTTSNVSPWSPNYIAKVAQADPNLKSEEVATLISLRDPQGFGENFRPYGEEWFSKIESNMDLAQFDQPLVYDAKKRAILTTNLHARVLPTDEPHFYSYKLAGQGYPFDNLQTSSVWAGTPVYILGETKDRNWALVLTPHFISWVHQSGIARADEKFVMQWENAAKQSLGAITHTETALIDEKETPRLTAYVGTVLPAIQSNDSASLRLLVPIADKNGRAAYRTTVVSKDNAALMPVPATPHQFASIFQTLKNRPYGWGGMYFYSDCSQELQSVYTPFGIWLPRHSSYQVQQGVMVDKTNDESGAPLSTDKRLEYLLQEGHPLTTIVYIGGHVLMYVGNYPNPNSSNHEPIAMTYQNLWGLRPTPPLPNKRVVIGESAFIPLLTQYPEDPNLASLASKQFFQVSFLDQMPKEKLKAQKSLRLHDLIIVKDSIN